MNLPTPIDANGNKVVRDDWAKVRAECIEETHQHDQSECYVQRLYTLRKSLEAEIFCRTKRRL